MKTHFKKLRNPNYIGSWDLMDENGKVTNKIVTITKVEKQHVFDGKGGSEELPVLVLKEFKPLILNATNIKAVAKAIDSDFIEDWVGKQIELTVKRIKAFGDYHDAIRVINKKVEKQELPELLPNSEKWQSAIQGLKTGYTIEQIKTKYSLTAENEQKLIKEAKNV